jgi:two-component system, sensor histidine kinase
MGYTSEQMVGKSASELLLEGQFKPYIEKVMNERDEGDSGQYEIPIKTGRGETRWLLINGCPMFDHNGNNIGSIGIHTDITIRKNIENELINAKNKVEETSRIKEVFFANMSHEIRTPMNGIVGITTLLAKTTLSPKQKLYLNAIQDSAKNLLVIIGDILDFSKMEAGKIQLNTERFNFHKLIDNVVQIFSYRASEKSLSLIKKISKDVPKYLIGDPVRINQILTNLVGNAIKFSSF